MTFYFRTFVLGLLSLTSWASSLSANEPVCDTAPWPTTFPPQPYTVVSVDGKAEDGTQKSYLNDGDWRTFWASHPSVSGPHNVVIDLGCDTDIQGFMYIPPPYRSEGRVANYNFYVSNDTRHWGEPVARGAFRRYVSTFWPDVKEQFETVVLPQNTHGRFIRFQGLGDISGRSQTAISELIVITELKDYPYKNTTLAHLKGQRMAPSIHMMYNVPKARLFYVEFTPEKTAPGTYFMTAGFSGGYFGLQEQANGNRVVLFSLWDAGNVDNPFMVHSEDQVKVLYEAPEMMVRRFGGEGVGVQSFYTYHWRVGQPYKFVVKVDHQLLPGWTVFTSFFFLPERNEWKKLMSLATKAPDIPLTGLNSFIEDFKRDFESYRFERAATVNAVWVKDLKTDAWVPSKVFRFTADGNPNRNVNAASRERGGYAVTGGAITNDGGKLWDQIPMGQEGNNPPKLPDEVLEKAVPDDVNDEDRPDDDDE